MITVPLHIVDADSTPITKQQIHQHVAYLNSVYNPQGVAFTFDDQVDYVSKAADPDWINQKNNVIEKYAYGLHGKLLLVLAGGGFGGDGTVFRALAGKGTQVGFDVGARGIAHEIGHTLCLQHAFRENITDAWPQGKTPDPGWRSFSDLFKEWVNPSGVLDPGGFQAYLERVLDGDAEANGCFFPVEDTPLSMHVINSVDPVVFRQQSYLLKGTLSLGTEAVTYNILPDQHNVMGYYLGYPELPLRLTPGQGQVIRGSLLQGHHRHIAFPKRSASEFVLDPVLAAPAPGELHLAAPAWDGRIQYKLWTQDKNGWSPGQKTWYDLGGTGTKGTPALVSWEPGHADIFVRWADNTIRNKAINIVNKTISTETFWPSVTGWNNLGGAAIDSPVAVSWGKGRLDLFAVFSNGALHWCSWDTSTGKWSGWTSLGGDCTGTPAVCAWGPGHIDVIVRWKDGTIRNKAFNDGAWWPGPTTWAKLGGTGKLPPRVVAWSPGHLDLVAVMGDGKVANKVWENGNWWPSTTGWNVINQNETPAFTQNVSLVAPEPGQLEIYAIGAYDLNLYRCVWTKAKGQWSPWKLVEGMYISGNIAAASWGPGHINLAARTLDGRIRNTILSNEVGNSSYWYLADLPASGSI